MSFERLGRQTARFSIDRVHSYEVVYWHLSITPIDGLLVAASFAGAIL
jgi:hypothetical protein